jgi:photosystem II stability/assembly factor-like uncharacterized protein
MRITSLAALAAAGLVAGCGSAAPSQVSPPTGASTSAPSAAPDHSASASPTPSGQAQLNCSTTPGPSPSANDLGAQLTGVQFVTPRQGWVVGHHQILATSNGGASWTVQDQGQLNLTSVDFISATTGWAAGANSLLTTSNGGRTWTALPEPCVPIRSVHFVSAQTGFAIAAGSGQLGTTSGLAVAPAPQKAGVLLATSDGGHSWRQLSSPANAQSVCFTSPSNGWLGANGGLYRSTNGGQAWTQVTAGPRPDQAAQPYTMLVQCAGPSSVWGLDIGYGVASNQQPHVGYYASQGAAMPLFAEQYFPHPGVSVTAAAPGAYAGVLSAISPASAAYVDWCGPCGAQGTAPWDLAANSGHLTKKGDVGGLTYATGASFLTPGQGWVVGEVWGTHDVQRIVHTADGGATWQVQYSSG